MEPTDIINQYPSSERVFELSQMAKGNKEVEIGRVQKHKNKILILKEKFHHFPPLLPDEYDPSQTK